MAKTSRFAALRHHPLGEAVPAVFPGVIPAKAGTYVSLKHRSSIYIPWVPAFAGTTLRLVCQQRVSFNHRI